ncbi:ribosome-recycling factor [Streptomyces seoulensis]|uniref:ribosome-recycling factor n=1 Tax=Streptomyces seoulensis TaxID=73044 RepID=UPI001FCA8C6E|nr:ribosome-recycling factor [Streptomyces seoulensis]BDH07435.1 hypothetical protein HEK131_46620 [Streptomyces seoulensis]
MVAFDDLLHARLGGMQDAVNDWSETVKKLKTLQEKAENGMQRKAEKADWKGQNAGVTRPFIKKTAKEFGDAAKEAESIRNILRDALAEFKASKKKLEEIVDAAPGKGMRIGTDGSISYLIHPDRRGKDYHGPDPKQADFDKVHSEMKAALDRATEADEVASRALVTLVGKDENNFSGTDYHSLKDAKAVQDAKEFVALSRKGAHASPSELAHANQLLREHNGDRLFAEKVATGMGGKGTMTYWAAIVDSHQGNMPKKELATLKDLQKNFSLTLAEATHSKSAQMQQWKKDVIDLGDRQFITDRTKETTGPFGFQITSSLMRHGEFDQKFLNDYGDKLIDYEKNTNAPQLWSHGGQYYDALNFGAAKNDGGRDPMTGFLEALGHNPHASTEFFHDKEHFNYLTGVETKKGPEPRIWPQDSASFVPSPDQKQKLPGFESLGHALESAVTGHNYEDGPSRNTSIHSAEQAEIMNRLVTTMSKDTDLVRDGMAGSLGKISAEYMSDIHRAFNPDKRDLDALFPNSGVDSQLREGDVTRFLHTVGRDPDGYAAVNLGQHQYTASIIDFHSQHPDVYVNSLTSRNPDAMKSAVATFAANAGEIEGVIGAGRAYALENKIVEGDDNFNTALGKAGTWAGSLAGIGVGLGTAPFAGPSGTIAGGLLGTATGEILNGIVGANKNDHLAHQVYRNGRDWEDLKIDTVTTTQDSIMLTNLGHSRDAGLYMNEASTAVEGGFGSAQDDVERYFQGEAPKIPKSSND